jgi:hypothetical protein
MLDHVSISVSDIAASERFHDAIMKALDIIKVGRCPDSQPHGGACITRGAVNLARRGCERS